MDERSDNHLPERVPGSVNVDKQRDRFLLQLVPSCGTSQIQARPHTQRLEKQRIQVSPVRLPLTKVFPRFELLRSNAASRNLRNL